jgi:hypothetical protein
MSFLDRLLGLLSAPAYALQRSKLGFLRLHVGTVLLGLFGAAYTAYRGWRYGFAPVHAAWISLCLLGVMLLLWVDRQHYIIFRRELANAFQEVPDLRPEEKLMLRGSGVFEVSQMRRYLVEVPVVFWTTQLAEHIIAARVRAINFLGVGVPSAERGWWYVFLEPRRVLELEPGELCFGLHCRPAVRVLYTSKKGREALYLSCNSPAQLAVLLKELQAKAQAARHAK